MKRTLQSAVLASMLAFGLAACATDSMNGTSGTSGMNGTSSSSGMSGSSGASGMSGTSGTMNNAPNTDTSGVGSSTNPNTTINR